MATNVDMTITPARPELLHVADAVAREKGIDRDEVLTAMEQAIQKAGRSKYGHELDIRAEINRANGEIHLILNTPTRKGAQTDEGRIRATAVRNRVPMITTITGSKAAVQAIAALRAGSPSVSAIQDYFPNLTRPPAEPFRASPRPGARVRAVAAASPH